MAQTNSPAPVLHCENAPMALSEWDVNLMHPVAGGCRTLPAMGVGRGTAEQWIKEGKLALRWMRLSCRAFRDNAVRLQLFAFAYNLANFPCSLALPDAVAQWSLTTLREKLVKIGAGSCAMDVTSCSAGRCGGVARTLRRYSTPDRPLARLARFGGLTGAHHEGGRSRGRTMRRDRPVAPEQTGDRASVALAAREPLFIERFQPTDGAQYEKSHR